MSIYKPPSCHICYTVLFYLRLCCSICYLFCRLFLSIFLSVLASLVDSLPVYVSDVHLLDLLVSIFDSAVILFCLDFCFLINLWIVFRLNIFLTAISSMYLSSFEVTVTPTRPVENVVMTTKGLQDRNNLLLDGRTVENEGKLILTSCVCPKLAEFHGSTRNFPW